MKNDSNIILTQLLSSQILCLHLISIQEGLPSSEWLFKKYAIIPERIVLTKCLGKFPPALFSSKYFLSKTLQMQTCFCLKKKVQLEIRICQLDNSQDNEELTSQEFFRNANVLFERKDMSNLPSLLLRGRGEKSKIKSDKD